MRRWHLFPALLVAAVTLAGAGACAFEPRHDRATAGQAPSDGAQPSTGVSAPPGPGQGGGEPAPATSPAAPSTPAAGATTPAAGPSGKPTSTPTPTRTPTPTATSCPQGERQREVETLLARLGGFGKVTVDGRQSADDCAAIKRFQRRYGISPAAGRAGPTTYDVARRLSATRTGDCRPGPGTTVCVNLTLQTVWVLRDGAVAMAPTVTRTGMAGFATPAGTFAIDRRNLREWSDPYRVWLPYWQHFYRGMGFHETTTYLHDPSIGSHGCVNLLPADAVRLWSLTPLGTRVHLFGRRPGT